MIHANPGRLLVPPLSLRHPDNKLSGLPALRRRFPVAPRVSAWTLNENVFAKPPPPYGGGYEDVAHLSAANNFNQLCLKKFKFGAGLRLNARW